MIEFSILKAGQCRHLEFMAIRGGRFRMVPFPALYFLLIHPDHGPILIDTGYSPRIFDLLKPFPFTVYGKVLPVEISDTSSALHTLQAQGIKASDVRHILITHFHVDHIAGLKDFPRATYWAAANSWQSVRHLKGLRALIHGFIPASIPGDFEDRFRPIETAKPWVDGGNLLGFDKGHDIFGDGSVIALPMPGHACGQIGVLIDTGDDTRTLVSADACWSSRAYRECRMPSPLVYPFIADLKSYRRTLGALHTLHTDDRSIRILPSHCSEVAAMAVTT